MGKNERWRKRKSKPINWVQVYASRIYTAKDKGKQRHTAYKIKRKRQSGKKIDLN